MLSADAGIQFLVAGLAIGLVVAIVAAFTRVGR